MLARYEDELTYISPSDHEMLDITIYFTKDKWKLIIDFFNDFIKSISFNISIFRDDYNLDKYLLSQKLS